MVPAALLLLLVVVAVPPAVHDAPGAPPCNIASVQTMSARETVPRGDNERRPQNRKQGSDARKSSFICSNVV